ncbi:MAG: AGE family epimerase/isomerase [Bacillota bacterium]
MYRIGSPLRYHRRLLSENPTLTDIRTVVPDYAAMLVSVMTALADRYDGRPAYPYIDTKLDLITGEDFDPADPLRGHGTIYGWIQGRGLEALVDHVRWLRRHAEIAEGQHLIPRLERMIREVYANLRRVWHQNGGHVFFFMTPEGEPFNLVDGRREPLRSWDPGIYGYSDTFSAKGLYAAAHYLGDTTGMKEAQQYCHQVDQAIWEGRFWPNERENPPDSAASLNRQSGPRFQGPYMIHLGTAAVLAEAGQDPSAVEMGLRLIRHILRTHVNLGRLSQFQHGDLWEAVGENGEPYEEDGLVRTNPGHAIEFAGLGLKFTAAAKRHPGCRPEQRAEIAEIEALMPSVLARNFANGYLPGPGGICLSVDLVSRNPVSEIMPWWSLPETIRAAAESWQVARTEEERRECLRILSSAHNAFAQHYVRPDLHLMAYQTRSTAGKPVSVIPATADADPGYHTGCSILDFLRVLEEQPAG